MAGRAHVTNPLPYELDFTFPRLYTLDMNLIEIDKQTALDLLERVVEMRGADYVYKKNTDSGFGLTCTYERDGEPSCAVGTALHLAGVDTDLLAEMDKLYFSYGSTGIADYETIEFLARNGINIYDGAKHVFYEFQDKQDMGMQYDKCLNIAKAVDY